MIASMLLAAQLACMTEAMYYEARSEGYRGMIIIGAVVHNRVLDSRWEDTVCGVIEEPSQFSYLPDGAEAGTLNLPNEVAKEKAEQAAYALLSSSNGMPMFDNILYYHAEYVLPNWNFDLLEYKFTYETHIFYGDAND